MGIVKMDDESWKMSMYKKGKEGKQSKGENPAHKKSRLVCRSYKINAEFRIPRKLSFWFLTAHDFMFLVHIQLERAVVQPIGG
jgi:hypothetical protein